jgi:hypothetical protein
LRAVIRYASAKFGHDRFEGFLFHCGEQHDVYRSTAEATFPIKPNGICPPACPEQSRPKSENLWLNFANSAGTHANAVASAGVRKPGRYAAQVRSLLKSSCGSLACCLLWARY